MLLFLTDIRKKLLALWTAGSIGIAGFLLVQSLGGRFEDMEVQAWIWWAGALLPVWTLLFVAALTNKNPSRVLFAATFRQVRWVLLFYLILCAGTLLSVRVAAIRGISLEHYLPLSACWLVPFQAMALGVVLLLFFRKEAILRPDPALLKEYLDKKMDYARLKSNLPQLQAFQLLVQENGVLLALNNLKNTLPENNTDLIMTQSRYATWKEHHDLGTLDTATLQLLINQITVAVVALIEDNYPS